MKPFFVWAVADTARGVVKSPGLQFLSAVPLRQFQLSKDVEWLLIFTSASNL